MHGRTDACACVGLGVCSSASILDAVFQLWSYIRIMNATVATLVVTNCTIAVAVVLVPFFRAGGLFVYSFIDINPTLLYEGCYYQFLWCITGPDKGGMHGMPAISGFGVFGKQDAAKRPGLRFACRTTE